MFALLSVTSRPFMCGRPTESVSQAAHQIAQAYPIEFPESGGHMADAPSRPLTRYALQDVLAQNPAEHPRIVDNGQRTVCAAPAGDEGSN